MGNLNDLIKQQQEALNKPEEEKTEEIEQLVGFIIGEEEYAVEILAIQEIIKPIEWTRVPFVPDYVLGVFNLRGTVLPLIDLRKKFGVPNAEIDEENTRFIVMKIQNEDVAFVIDRLTSAIRIPKKYIAPPPETYNNEEELIAGVGKLEENRIITILNVDNLIKKEEIVPSRD